MTDVVRLKSLTHDINASATTIDTAPSSFTTLLPRAPVPSLMPRTREPIDRPLVAVDGRRFPRMHGVKNISPIELPLEFRGANSNTGGAVADWEAKLEQGKLLASLFGAVGTATSSAAPTVSGGSGTSLTASTNVIQTLDIILVPTSAGNEVRQVTAGGGTTSLTVAHAFVGTPTVAGTIIRLGRYTLSPTTTVHKPIWFNAEGESWRRRYKDCQPSRLVLNIPNAGAVEADFTFLPNDWDDQAEANPSFSDVTAGNPIVSGGNTLIIAAKACMLRNARLTIDNGMVMRETSTGTNGVRGGVATDKTNVMLEGELYLGDDSGTIGELVDDSGTPSLDAILGDSANPGDIVTTRDVMLQVGLAAGQVMFVRLPAADIRSAGVVAGGPFAVVPFTAHATVTGSLAPLYLGVG